MTTLDDACRELRAWLETEGHERVQVTVRADGRVYLAAIDGAHTRVWCEADIEHPGDPLAAPSEAMEAMRGRIGPVHAQPAGRKKAS